MADTVETWVRRINQLARSLDEAAAAMHPSAWPETLRDDIERFKRLAAVGPRQNDENPEARR